MASETVIAWLDGVKQILPQVYLPTLQHSHGVWPPQRLKQLDLYIGVTVGVLVQEIRKDAFYDLRRSGQLQLAGIPAP